MDELSDDDIDIYAPEFGAITRALVYMTIIHFSNNEQGVTAADMDRYVSFIAKKENDHGYSRARMRDVQVDSVAFKTVYRQIAYELIQVVTSDHPELTELMSDAYENPRRLISEFKSKTKLAWIDRDLRADDESSNYRSR